MGGARRTRGMRGTRGRASSRVADAVSRQVKRRGIRSTAGPEGRQAGRGLGARRVASEASLASGGYGKRAQEAYLKGKEEGKTYGGRPRRRPGAGGITAAAAEVKGGSRPSKMTKRPLKRRRPSSIKSKSRARKQRAMASGRLGMMGKGVRKAAQKMLAGEKGTRLGMPGGGRKLRRRSIRRHGKGLMGTKNYQSKKLLRG